MTHRWLLISVAAEALCVVAFLGFVVRATSAARTLAQDLKAWQAKFDAAQQATSAADRFQHDEGAVADQERAVSVAIPLDEREPLTLVKQLTRLAERAGAVNLSVSIKPTMPVSTSHPSSAASTTLTMVPLQMDFELEFVPLLAFLKNLRSLERVTMIQEIRVIRSDSMLPRQQVTLILSAYTLSSS